VLTAPPSVREESHHVAVEFAAGLAHVRAELQFVSAGEKPAEVAYRLAIPPDAALFALEVCNARGCRSGIPNPNRGRGPLNAYDDAVRARGPAQSAGLPAGDARVIHDARGSAIWLRAAPVVRERWLRVRVDYATYAPVHAGVLRLSLPARGMDARAAPMSVQVRAGSYADLRINEVPTSVDRTLEIDAWSPLEFRATAAPRATQETFWKTACGNQSCLHVHAVSPATAAPATDIFLAIDASPSMEGEPRSRLLSTVAALLAQAPPGSQVRALRFAGESAPLLSERKPARDLALAPFAPIAFEAELGASTRFEAAWRSIDALGFASNAARKLVILVGDGGITTGPARPFEAAKRKRVEVAVVNVADRATRPELVRGAQTTGGAVLEVGSEAALAVQSGRSDKLEERLAAVYQPSRGAVSVPPLRTGALELRAGDSITWEGTAPAPATLRWGSRTLVASAAPAEFAPALAAHVLRTQAGRTLELVAVDRADLERAQSLSSEAAHGCERRGPAQRRSGLSSDAAPLALAVERATCALPRTPQKNATTDKPALGSGMPGSPLLSMLRMRIMPVARGCFRRDRAGRADYQVRAVFEFELAEREVVSAKVQGQIAEPLRACLLAAVDGLNIPPFTGKVAVRYPLVTEREPLPSQIELTPATANQLDSVTGGPSSGLPRGE